MHRQGISEWLSLMATGTIKTGVLLSSYVYLSLMVVLMALDPFMRYLIGSPFFWSNEVTTYLMMLMVFNGFGITLVKERHIRITLIFDRLPSKAQSVMWVITSLIGLFYVSCIGYALLRLTLTSFTFKVRSATAEMLIYPWQVLAMVGMVVFAVAMVMFTVRRIAIASERREEEIRIDKSAS